MADRYWVGGDGNWSDNTNHWSASDGGSPGASTPAATDNVNFTNQSSAANAAYTVTLDPTGGTKTCLDFNMAGPGGGNKVTWSGSTALTISGSLNLSGGSAGINALSFTGNITFNSTSTGKTLTFNGLAVSGGATSWTFNGAGGGWTLQDDMNIAPTNLFLTQGALDTNAKAMKAQSFTSTGALTRSLDMNGSTVTVNNGVWNVTSSLSLTVNTSSVITTVNTLLTFTGGGLTYNDVTVPSSAITSVTLSGANTFRNITLTGWANSAANTFSLGGNQTISGTLALAGGNSPSARPLISSNTVGTARTLTAATVTGLTDLDFQDITGAGAATWSGTRLGDATGNSGITFTTPANKFYVGNTGNWNAVAWATSSGGGANANNFPLPQDSAIFDANSFSANSQTVTLNNAYRLPGLDFSAITKTGITLADSTNAQILFGGLTLEANMVTSGTGTFTYSGRNTQSINTAGVTMTMAQIVDSPGGTVQLAANLTTNSLTTLTRGTLDLNGKTLSTTTFSSSNTNTRVLTFGSGGKIATTVTSASTAFNTGTSSGLTINRTGGTVQIDGNTTNTRTINTGGLNLPDVVFTNTTASGQLTFVGGSLTVKSISVSHPPQTVAFTSAQTVTIEDTNGFPSGTAGNLVTITSTTAANHNLAKSGASGTGNVTCSYLSVSRSQASPAFTFIAGHTSTDSGNNTGWLFGDLFLADQAETGAAADAVTGSTNEIISESVTAADAVVGDAIYSLTETLTASEDVTGAVTGGTNLDESVGVMDIVTGARLVPGDLVESGVAVDLVAASLSSSAAIAESGGAIDVITGVQATALTESLSATDVFVLSTYVPLGAVQETLTTSESMDGTASMSNAIAEAGNAVDLVTAIQATTGALVEAGAAVDATTGNFITTQVLTEALSAVDAIDAVRVFATVTLTEAGAASDAVTAQVRVAGQLTESVAAVDATTGVRTTTGILAESSFAIDAPAATFVAPTALAEALSAAENITGVRTTGAALVEAASASDALTGIRGVDGANNETLAALDTLSMLYIAGGRLVETLAAIDTPSAQADFATSLLEVLEAEDTLFSPNVSHVGSVRLSAHAKAAVNLTIRPIPPGTL